MTEKVKRLPPLQSVMNELFALSGNYCALCDENLFTEKGYIGEICHIEAASEGGARFNRNSNNEKRRSKANLLLLCSNCHKKIDNKANIAEYSVDYLKEVKQLHEKKFYKNKLKLNQQQEDSLLYKFENIDKELLIIKNSLTRIKILTKFERRIVGKYEPSEKLLNDDLLYFTEYENKKIFKFLNQIIRNNNNQYLILGNPASGKTTLGYYIYSELKKQEITSYYVNIKDIKDNIVFFDDIDLLSDFQVVIFVDNIHLNIQLAIELFQKANEYQNITFLYSSRIISKENQIDDNGLNIYEELKNSTYKIEYSETDLKAKIYGIINKKINSKKALSQNISIGNFNSVFHTVNSNLLKLTLLLEIWDTKHKKLDEINDDVLNYDLYKRYLSTFQGDEIQLITCYSVLHSFETEFEVLDEHNNIVKNIELNGIMRRNKNDFYSFSHPQFAEILIDAIISKSDDFSRKYKNHNDFIYLNTKRYILSFSSFEYSAFPKNLDEIINNLQQNKGKEIFRLLVADKEIEKIIVDFFKQNPNYLRGLSDFFKGLKNYYPSLISQFGNNIFSSLEQVPEVSNFEHIKTIAYILKKYANSKTYADFATKYFDKTKIESYSAINLLTYSLVYLYEFDRQSANRIVKNLNKENLVAKFEKTSIGIVGNSLIELKKINKPFAYEIFDLLKFERIFANSKKTSLIQISKGLNELYQFDKIKVKKLFTKFDFSFLKPILYCSNIDRVSKAYNEFSKIDINRTKQLYDNIEFDYYYSELRALNLSNLARVLSEIYKFSNTKAKRIISDIYTNEEWQVQFFSVKNLNQLAEIIKNLQNMHPNKIEEIVNSTNFIDFFQLKINKSSALHISYFLQALSRVNLRKSQELYEILSLASLVSKIENKNIFITHIEQIFGSLWKVIPKKTTEFLGMIDNYLFVKKAMKFEIKFHEIVQVLGLLNKINPVKTQSIYNNLLNQNVFKKKAKQSGIIEFLRSYSKLYLIEPVATSKYLKETLDYYCNKKPNFNNDISNLGIAIWKFSTVNIEESKLLLKAYKSDIAKSVEYSNLKQISSGLINCAKTDKEITLEITKEINFNILISKGIEAYTSDLTRCISEICIANREIGNKLKNELIKRGKLKYLKKK